MAKALTATDLSVPGTIVTVILPNNLTPNKFVVVLSAMGLAPYGSTVRPGLGPNAYAPSLFNFPVPVTAAPVVTGGSTLPMMGVG